MRRPPLTVYRLSNPTGSWSHRTDVRVERTGGYLVVTRPCVQWSLFLRWWWS